MYRQKILMAICLLAFTSCSGTPPAEIQGDVTGGVRVKIATEHGVASVPPLATTPANVPSRLVDNPAPVNDYLPGIPQHDLPAKLPSELAEFWRSGNVKYLKSSNAIENGTKMNLNAVDGNPAWVIYQIPNLLPMTELIEFRIELSNPNFGGSDAGYWIGFANYDKNSWQLMASTTVNPLKTLAVPSSDPFMSPANNFYVFVMLTGDQSLTVDRVGLEFNTPAWVEIVVDDDNTEGVSTGWMPSIVFDLIGNPLIAYAELGTGKPRLAKCDRNAEGGLGNLANWDITWIDQDPEDSGDLEPDTGAIAKWPDITLDEFNGMPRVSLIYDEIEDKQETSRAGISVMLPGGQWLNYRVGWIDGAEWTSIDSIPGTPIYGLATSAENPNWVPSRDEYDLTYITFDISDMDHVYDLYHGYGENWRFPHLKYDPSGGEGVLMVFGSSGYHENLTPDVWDSFSGNPNSNEFGSLAINPTNDRFGSTYSEVNIFSWDLKYVEYDAAFVGTEEIVDTLPRPNGVERIGDVSQLAYMPDGTPVIAYTVFDGSFVEIMYAEKVGVEWETATVSSERSLAETLEDRFVVDIAIDSNGVPVICYHHRDTQGNNSLRLVYNEG